MPLGSFLTAVREAELNFLCVCKPQSHRYLAEYIESLRESGDLDRCEHSEWNGREHRRVVYEWADAVPIRTTADAMEVGWFSVEITAGDGRCIYRSSFITNHHISANTVAELVAVASPSHASARCAIEPPLPIRIRCLSSYLLLPRPVITPCGDRCNRASPSAPAQN